MASPTARQNIIRRTHRSCRCIDHSGFLSLALVWIVARWSPPAFGARLGQQSGAEVAEFPFDAAGKVLARGLPLVGHIGTDDLDAQEVTLEEGPWQAPDIWRQSLTVDQLLNLRRQPVLDAIIRPLPFGAGASMPGCQPLCIDPERASEGLPDNRGGRALPPFEPADIRLGDLRHAAQRAAGESGSRPSPG
jgi:hypothetical protein